MLLDDLKNLAKAAEFTGCVVGKWINEQDPEVAQVLEDLTNKPGLSLTKTLDLIKKHEPNLPFKRTAFVTHMRKVCACQAT